MTDSPALQSRPADRRDLVLVLLLGAAGAGLVLLAVHQGWAQVQTAAPKPLPAGSVTESGQALVPAAAALALAALASLAAVLATRQLLRRITGLVLAGFGIAIAVAVTAGISAADVRAAALASTGSAAVAGSGTGAGSVTSGGSPGTGTAPVAGFAGHVVFTSFPWRGLAVAGALAVIAAGLLVAWRAGRMPVMSGRFDLPARSARRPPLAERPGAAGPASGTASSRDSATMWESLSRGEDPTAEQDCTAERDGAPDYGGVTGRVE
jgi:uncharacterized membrane protein (TIGR02234 family)